MDNTTSTSHGWFWTLFIGLLFLYAFSASGYFIYMAVKTNNGAVTDSPYSDSLVYEEKLETLRAAHRLGWSLSIIEKSQDLLISLEGKEGIPLTNSKITFKALFPADATRDFEGAFEETDAQGTYKATPAFPTKGQWLVQINATNKKNSSSFERTLLIH